MFYKILTVVSAQYPSNLTASLERWIAHNPRKPSFLFHSLREDFRELEWPVERAAAIEQRVYLFAQLVEGGAALGFALRGEALLAALLVGADQHSVFYVEGILQQCLSLGVAERGGDQEVRAQLDQFHRFLGFGQQPRFGFDIAHVVFRQGAYLAT